MKETYYFPHDNNAHNDPKLMNVFMETGLAGIGLYWIIIELLHQQEDGKITHEQFKNYIKWYGSREDATLVQHLFNIYLTNDLFYLTDDGFIYSKRVLKNKEFREDLSKKRSEAGKESAKKRALNSDNSTSVEQNKSFVEQGKERKRKEKKENESKGNINTNIISKDITTKVEEPIYGNEDINNTLKFLCKSVGIDTFKESQDWQRRYGKNFINYISKIGKEEFINRLKGVLSDDFKAKNCNSIKYLYNEIKSFIYNPVLEKERKITIY